MRTSEWTKATGLPVDSPIRQRLIAEALKEMTPDPDTQG
jgi:hypothetical protein